jgi:hypothetical protein
MVFVDEDPDDPALIREYEMLARVFNSLAATYAEHFDDLPMMMATPEGRFVRFAGRPQGRALTRGAKLVALHPRCAGSEQDP